MTSSNILLRYKKSFRALVLLWFITGIGILAKAQSDPQKAFQGTIGRTLKESKIPDATIKKNAANAPNIVWILLDDVGFGATSAFGGLIETPTFDSLANNGLRYTNFHVEAYCSPTRAALLTGRNHHSVHMGLFPETANDYPGYDARIPFEKATAAEIFRENGYNTFAVGKWHITPVSDATQAGPFNRWPTGRGFEHYYGFLYGETDQYAPQLWENITKIEPDLHGKELNEVLADKAIGYIADQKLSTPGKPFFLYLATGATHEPIQVSPEWRNKYKGKFDDGWDAYRELTLANQKKLGLVPQNAVLPKNPVDRAWNSLTENEKKVYAAYFENYAGFLSYTDYQVGRVINYIKQIGQLDNTLIVLVIGDNGASGEGGETGYLYPDYKFPKTNPNDTSGFSNNLRDLAITGTSDSKPHYPRTWATAANTPFRSWKGNAGAEGGTHNPLIVFYPKVIKERGIRNQYTHVIDVLPTTIELAKVKVPVVINGYKQDSIEGKSFYNSVNNAKAITRHTVQYYEVAGRRAIYKDGWKAGTEHKDGDDFSKDEWELYNITEDFNENVNLATKFPQKLKELQQVFDQQAWKYNIYPLKDWNATNFDNPAKTIYDGVDKVVLYPGTSQIFSLSGPSLDRRSFSITADAEITTGTEGVLFASGGHFGGLSLFIKDGNFFATLNSLPVIAELKSFKPVPQGKVQLRFELKYKDVPSPGETAGTEAIYINDEKVGELPIKKYQASIAAYDEGIDVGNDFNTAVSSQYKVPFAFTGRLNTVTIQYK
ncbi:MAG: arylsulfatase [Agriterribacter sp.]